MKNIFILFLFAIIGCAGSTWSTFYPNVKINPEKFKYNLPNDYEDCLMQFDSILSAQVIEHNKMEVLTAGYFGFTVRSNLKFSLYLDFLSISNSTNIHLNEDNMAAISVYLNIFPLILILLINRISKKVEK